MKLYEKNVLIWAIIAFVLLIIIIKWGNYLITNDYIVKEGYNNNNNNSDSIYYESDFNSTNHTINLPINSDYKCENMCGPLNRCYKTGEQCSSDIDCYGCRKVHYKDIEQQIKTKDVIGQNEAGKLTGGFTPTYSVLTTDIGTKAKLINDKLRDPPKYAIGINTWRQKFDIGEKLFDKRYGVGSQQFIPNYPTRKTLSGEFIDDGPLASNAYL